MKMTSSILLGAFLATACATSAPPSLDQQVDSILSTSSVTRIGIAYYDLADGSNWFRNEREVFHAASTMKVPVMMGLFRAIERGELSLDQPVQVTNEFISIYDGSTFSLEPAQDSDPKLYEQIGQELPLGELIRRMIVRSSNLATNIVIQLVGADSVMRIMTEIGATDMKVLRGVEDIEAYRHGMNNTATARDLMLVLRDIATRAEQSGESAADEMIEILSHQEFNEGIPAGLPEGVRVAHKTGTITEIYHDAAIVYPPGRDPYILVVLTGGTDSENASRAVAAISRLFWNHHLVSR